MRSLSTDDLVLVHLWAVDDPEWRTTVGICDALGVGTSVSGRVEVLSALSTLREEGLLEERAGPGDRTLYALTDTGAELAAELHEEVVDSQVELIDGEERRTVPLDTARDDVGAPSIASVIEQAAGGRLRVDDVPSETFVGREAALETINGAMRAATGGDTAVIRLLGERGVGKTELIRQAADRTTTDETAVLSITCRSDPSEPFEPVREALAAHGVADVFERSAITPDRSGALVSLQRELFQDVRSAIADIAASGPVLITVDDVHEAGSETMDLFEALTADLPDGVVVVFATRLLDADGEHSSSVDDWFGDDTVDIELGPLSAAETRELVVRLLGTRSVPESVTDRLYERTGGLPLFVIELVAQLQEEGAIDPDAGFYPDADERLPTPDDSSEAIRQRLAALDESARAVLEDAAIIGETPDQDVLAAVSSADSGAVQEYLELFAATGLFESTAPPRFLSGLLREAVLEGIPEDRQQQRHQAVAEAYEAVHDDPPHVAIASHYERAGNAAAALQQYRAAGEAAMDVYANEAALDAYERALSLARDLDDDEALVDIVESIGRIHFVTGEYDEADRYFEYLREQTDDLERIQSSYRYQAEMASDRGETGTAEEYVRAGLDTVDDPTRVSCRLIGHLGWYQLQRGEIDEAEEYFERQHELAERLGDEDRLGGAYHNLGTIAHHRGDTEAAIEAMEQAVEYNERSGAVMDAIASYNNLSMVYHRAGRIGDAIEALETAQERAVEIGDRSTVLTARGNLASYHHQRGRLDLALEIVEDVIETAQQRGLSSMAMTSLVTAGFVLTDRCRFEAARERFERAIGGLETTENLRMMANGKSLFARLELYEGNLDAARELVDRTLEDSDSFEPELRSTAQLRLGDIERADGDFEAAIEAYERSLEHARSSDNLRYQVFARFRLGATRSDLTGGEEGLATVKQAAADSEQFDAPFLRCRAIAAEARCHRNAGDYETAADRLDDAEAHLDGIDAPLYTCWIRVERALLAADRGDEDAREQLEAATRFVDDHGVTMLATLCRSALETDG